MEGAFGGMPLFTGKKVRQQGKREGKTLLPQECGFVQRVPSDGSLSAWMLRARHRTESLCHITLRFFRRKSSRFGKKARKKVRRNPPSAGDDGLVCGEYGGKAKSFRFRRGALCASVNSSASSTELGSASRERQGNDREFNGRSIRSYMTYRSDRSYK